MIMNHLIVICLRYRGFLTEFEQKKFDFTRQTKYWWTYTTCIFYGLVAIIFFINRRFKQLMVIIYYLTNCIYL